MHEPDILIDTKASWCESDYSITLTCIRQATHMQTEKDFQRDLLKINRASCLMEVSYADSCYIAQKRGNVSVRRKKYSACTWMTVHRAIFLCYQPLAQFCIY